MQTFKSDLTGQEFPLSEKVSAKTIRISILKTIKKDYPNFNSKGFLALSELNNYRERYIESYLRDEKGEITELEKTVLKTMNDGDSLVDKLEDSKLQNLTFGQRVADKVASFGGSWTFIISFGFFILVWILINIYILTNRSFDPYPFILLNLILSC
ncbi:MAG: DUF1003 domain-containing protein, partial [Bacteroidota bacterium]|nr:DUF1003 domain-containing protein [Bacteroidota bacterium]